MSLRFPFSVGLALLVTFGLFWGMQALVGVEGELGEAKPALSVEFVRLRKDKPPETKKREPPKREKPEQPPPPPDISMSKAALKPGDTSVAIGSMVDAADALEGAGFGAGADRDVVPLVRIDPDYPMQARQRGIEGWVVLQFTITSSGTVHDVVVLQAHPGTVFNRAALQAVQKWKYNPKIENGQPVERQGIKVRLDFVMDS